MTDVCHLLDWDTGFFGVRIARLDRTAPTAAELQDALIWCETERIECLYLLADANDPATTRLAEDAGFHLRDIRMTLARALAGSAAGLPPGIRTATEGDIDGLARIAETSHTDSRFYYDPGFPREHCDALYRTWIERSCRGYAQQVFVADHEGVAAGYITCHKDEDAGRIGLLAVAEAARGGGLGSRLISAALQYFAASGFDQTTVVTQGRNTAAQRLYIRHGFLPQSTEVWYHRWFRQPEQEHK